MNRGYRHKMKTRPFKFNKEKVIYFIKTEADGNSIFESKSFAKELGFKGSDIQRNIKKHIAIISTSPHATYVNEVHEGKGIDCLEFLYYLGGKLGVATDNPFRTRSFQFKYLSMSILHALESNRS